jgi:3',5'-cyclic AMP phosphodiesterase CpdA
MDRRVSVAIVSDVHYASAAEQERGDYCLCQLANPVQRLAVRLYRHYVWLRDPFAHNELLNDFIERTRGADIVVANGDYSCDSGFVGISDDAAFASARECLEKLRAAFGSNLSATLGDHEFGKKPLGANVGGLRIRSFSRATSDLEIAPFWKFELGNYVLMGITSSVAALPVYESEALREEVKDWRELHKAHLAAVRQAFSQLRPYQRVLLFCHDPTALPYLWHEKEIREKLPQVERTIIGHLHSNLVLFKSRILAGCPPITFMGHTVRRITIALREARLWRHFNVLLCPSLAGMELLKDGGFVTAELELSAAQPPCYRVHRVARSQRAMPS